MEKSEKDPETHNKNKQDKNGNTENQDFEWSGRGQHLFFFYAYIMNYCVVGSIISKDENRKELFLIPFLILAITLGNSSHFFQNCVGQYTRNGVLIIGQMFPILYGLGFSMMFLLFVELVAQYFYTIKLVSYLASSMINYPLPWMTCYSGFYTLYPGCISRKDIDLCSTLEKSKEPCFNSSRIFAGEIYKEVYSFRSKIYTELNWPSNPQYLALVCLFQRILVLIFLLAGTDRPMKTFYPSLRIGMIFCFLLLLTIVIDVFIQPGAYYGMLTLYKETIEQNLFHYEIWTTTLKKLINSLKLAEGGHILFGSFIPSSNPDNWRSSILILGYLALCFGMIVYYELFLGLFYFKLGVDINEFIEETEVNEVFVIFPTFLGILPSSELFSFIFFAVLFLISYFSMVVKVMVIEKSFSMYFNVSSYFIYMRFSICALIFIVSAALEVPWILKQYSNLKILIEVCSVALVALQHIMLFFYGMESMSDDIEFMMKVKIKLFLKFTWFFMPIICLATTFVESRKIDFHQDMTFKMMFISLISTPVFLGFLYNLILLTKNKDLIGILKHTDRYGPPNIEDRILRVLYNPKLTVRYKRREEICTHECLLNCNALRTAIEDEMSQMLNFTEELKLKAIDKTLENKIMLQFEQHKKYFQRALKTTRQSCNFCYK